MGGSALILKPTTHIAERRELVVLRIFRMMQIIEVNRVRMVKFVLVAHVV